MLFLKAIVSGAEITAEPTNTDFIRYDLTRAKHGWPPADQAPFLWQTFLAWAYLKRTGQYSGTWEQFSETECTHVEGVETDPDSDPKSLSPVA